MADEYVSKEQFGEFGKRMEQAFAHVHQCLDEQHQNFCDPRRYTLSA